MRFAAQAVYRSARQQPGAHAPDAPSEALLVDLRASSEAGSHLFYAATVKNVLDQKWAIPAGDEFGQQQIPQYVRTFLLEATIRY